MSEGDELAPDLSPEERSDRGHRPLRRSTAERAPMAYVIVDPHPCARSRDDDDAWELSNNPAAAFSSIFPAE